MNWLYLSCAILTEVIGTLSLKASDGLTRLGYLPVIVVAYATSFYCLSFTLKSIPVGIAYAVWSGAGIVLIVFFSWLAFRQSLDLAALIGIALIIAGVLVLNLFSKSTAH
jgi:small multidrug resistance pump